MLPVYALRITDETDGVNVISVVTDPAIMESCMKFSKQEKIEIKLERNDEKQELFGPVLIPDLLIYRRDSKTDFEYFVVFERDTIEQIEKKYFKDNFNFNVSLEHSGDNIPGFVFESFIKNSELGINPEGWDVPDGTWFVRMRIDSKEDWNRIKEEGLTGFSCECFMGGVEIGETEQFRANAWKVAAKSWLDELLEGKI